MRLIYIALLLMGSVLGLYLYSGVQTNIFCRETYKNDYEILQDCRQSAKEQMDEAIKIAMAMLTSVLALKSHPAKEDFYTIEDYGVGTNTHPRSFQPFDHQSDSPPLPTENADWGDSNPN